MKLFVVHNLRMTTHLKIPKYILALAYVYKEMIHFQHKALLLQKKRSAEQTKYLAAMNSLGKKKGYNKSS